MNSNNPSNPLAPARPVDFRYLHIGGAFAVGGAFTRVGGNVVFVPIPTVACVELPMTGGLSTAKVGRFSLDCSKVKFGPMEKQALSKLRRNQLLSIASATATCRSRHVPPDQPKGSTVNVEVKGVRVEGGFSLKSGILNLQSDHPRDQRFPSITFGPTSVMGMKLGKLNVEVEFDL